jgi:asparagine synthase (glutamine-hydrolysing)
MNSFFGIICFDGSPVTPQELAAGTYKSPFWKATAEHSLCVGSVGFISAYPKKPLSDPQYVLPYCDPESGCILVGDFYLTDRKGLCSALGLLSECSDAELILKGYSKWGEGVFSKLSGVFSVVIWDPVLNGLFVGVDHMGSSPCLFHYVPGKYVMVGNTCTFFHQFGVSDRLRLAGLSYFALDGVEDERGCFSEISRVGAAHYYTFSSERMIKTRHWALASHSLRYQFSSREAWYEAFRALFADVVSDYMRFNTPISAHISGGLDSTSVAAMAALELEKSGKPLHGFTAIPRKLSGPSQELGWFHHEMPVVESLLQKYPSIQHQIHYSDHNVNYFERLSCFLPQIDQPIRNVQNMEWILASYEAAHAIGSDVILTGQRGNGSISWIGYTPWERFKQRYRHFKWVVKAKLKKQSFGKDLYYSCLKPEFLNSDFSVSLFKKRAKNWDIHRYMLEGMGSSGRQTSLFPISLHYGIRLLDPTADKRILEFCYSAPYWVFYQSNTTLGRRCLVRQGLSGILPDAVRFNRFRGKQASDWFENFNRYYPVWEKESDDFFQANPTHPLFQIYEYSKIKPLFSVLNALDPMDDFLKGNVLIRYMSALLFCKRLLVND